MLTRNTFFVREHVALIKLTGAYDILDPETQAIIGIAREEPPAWAKYLRLFVNRKFLPTVVNVYESEDQPPLFSIQKPFSLLRSKVTVIDGSGTPFGYFVSKLFSFGGGFFVYDMEDRQVAEIKGDWKGWNFKFISVDNVEIGTVTKKWAGIGKELFTSADSYIISLSDGVAENEAVKMLLLAAGLAIDIVFKGRK